MTTREVVIKDDDSEKGSAYGHPIWESDTTEYGKFARLDRADDGRLFVSITDMEMHDSSWESVPLTDRCLDELRAAIAPPAPAVAITEAMAQRAGAHMALNWPNGYAKSWDEMDEIDREAWTEEGRGLLEYVFAAAQAQPGGEASE